MKRKTIAATFCLLLLIIIPFSQAGARNIIKDYVIIDELGDTVIEAHATDEGTGCGNPNLQYTGYKEIIPGRPFYITLTLKNTATNPLDNENSGQLLQKRVKDTFGYYMGDNSQIGQEAAVGNFTNIQAPAYFSLAPQEEKTYTSGMDAARYLYPGDYKAEFYITSSGACGILQELVIPIGNNNEHFYLQPVSWDFTNWNLPQYYDAMGNWEIYFNVTYRNLGENVADPSTAFTGFVDCFGQGYDGTNYFPDCAPPFSLQVPLNEERKYSCKLDGLKNLSFLSCNYWLNNKPYNFHVNHNGFFRTNLGDPPVAAATPTPPPNWEFILTDPAPKSLYAVPGRDFNETTILKNLGGTGNLTVEDNANITWDLYDATGKRLTGMSRFALPVPGEDSFNTTGITNVIDWFEYNLNINIPRGTVPSHGLIKLFATPKLIATAAAAVDFGINGGCPGDNRFSIILNICNWYESLQFSRLIYLQGKEEITTYVSPGNTYNYQFEVKNPLSQVSNYLLKPIYAPTQGKPGAPFIFSVSPNPILVGAATSVSLGSAAGVLSVFVPPGTAKGRYKYIINASSQQDPDTWDSATLNLIVLLNDVEVIAINKTPNRFIYNPALTERIYLTVLVANNGEFQQNVTLNLTTKGGLKAVLYQGCGGANFTLEPQQQKNVDCDAHVNISEFDRENVLVTADLGLLTSTDSLPENNHKSEVITVIREAPPEVSVPDSNILLFVGMLIMIMLMKRNRGR